MKTCVFAGTFDPFTLGHKAIVDKLLNARKRVIITVGNNPEKTPFLSESERADIIKATYRGNKKVRVIIYSDVKDGYADFLKKSGATEYYRGIRDVADLEYEKKAEEKNKEIYPDIETKYIFANRFSYISSTFIKERVGKGLEVKRFIPKKAYKVFRKILKEKQKGN